MFTSDTRPAGLYMGEIVLALLKEDEETTR